MGPRTQSPRSSILASACFVLCAAVVIAVFRAPEFQHEPLPSIRSWRDELQYFPPGPKFKLRRQVAAIEEYERRQAGLNDRNDDPHVEASAEADDPPGIVEDHRDSTSHE